MHREVTDREGTTWTCAQAYAGLDTTSSESHREDLKQQAAQAEAGGQRVEVVCTPSGGAGTVRLELEEDWNGRLTDEELSDRIADER